ncbi:Peroxisomal membrane protein PMP27 [Hypocenomyce scalaris]|nr:Peroxisomal membrane protein PMP27 [Hypocenomyce scalaris]
MVADAVIYHPTVAHYLRFVATTVGCDKILRTLQYFSRFYSWYLFRTNATASSIVPFDAIKKQFLLTRKLMRVGKNVEHLKAAAVAADSKGDAVLKYCAVGRQLAFAVYFSFDTVDYLHAAGIRKSANAKRVHKEALRFWFVGITFNVVAGLYALWQLRQKEQRIDKKDGEGVVESKKLTKERTATNIQLISDLCDMTIPLSALEYANLDDGIVGLAGTVSSLLGVWSQWKKTA